jgi:hypothetical protein
MHWLEVNKFAVESVNQLTASTQATTVKRLKQTCEQPVVRDDNEGVYSLPEVLKRATSLRGGIARKGSACFECVRNCCEFESVCQYF